MSKSEGQVLDFEKICRLCLLEKRSMSSIFAKKKSDKKVPLPVRIMSCASLELYEGDGLPASICSKCLLSVNQSYAFREQCEQADTTLRQYAQRMNEASGETSSNREPREHITKGSLEYIEDVGIKIEELHNGEDQDFERCNNLDLNCCGKVTKSSVENLHKCEKHLQKKESLFECTVKENAFEKINAESCKEDNSNRDVKVDPLEASNDDLSKRFAIKEESEIGEFKKTEENSKCNGNVNSNFRKSDYLGSPLLKTLSEEKAEDVVVAADVAAVLGNEQCGFVETECEDGDSLTKSRAHKWFQHGIRKRKYLSSLLGKEKSSKENPPVKSNFENKGHFELLKNLMKNKNIIVQKRAACVPANLLTEKFSTLNHADLNKNLRRRKGLKFGYDFKIAQLWKEWEEVNKRIPKVSRKPLEAQAEKQSFLETSKNGIAFKAQHNELKGGHLLPQESEDLNESAVQEKKYDENVKTKWKNAKDMVYCKDCKIFLLKSSYSNHIKFVHKKIRKYLCQTCGYAACTGTILRQHVQAVHVGYSFFCDQCPKKFNLMKRLRKHVELQHSGKPVERNHICQYCGMAFVKPGCLRRHLRSHTQETPYQCQYCQRRFKYRWPKVQHERLHTGEKPYKCSFCEEKFTQNCVRKAHEYKKHGNEEFRPKTRSKEKSTRIRVVQAEKEDSEVSYNSALESS